MKKELFVHEWLVYPAEMRATLMQTFKIGKTGVVHVENNRLICDGVTERDLAPLSLAALLEFVIERGLNIPLIDQGIYMNLLNLVIENINEPKTESITIAGEPTEPFAPATEPVRTGSVGERKVTKRKSPVRKGAKGKKS